MTADVSSTVAGIFVVSGLGLLLNIVAVAIPQWAVAVGPFQSVVKLGLWNVSAEGSQRNISGFGRVTSRLSCSFAAYIYAVRAMTILSILFEASSMAGTVEALRKIKSDSGKFRKRAKESGEISVIAGAYGGLRFQFMLFFESAVFCSYISCRRSHCLRS